MINCDKYSKAPYFSSYNFGSLKIDKHKNSIIE